MARVVSALEQPKGSQFLLTSMPGRKGGRGMMQALPELPSNAEYPKALPHEGDPRGDLLTRILGLDMSMGQANMPRQMSNMRPPGREPDPEIIRQLVAAGRNQGAPGQGSWFKTPEGDRFRLYGEGFNHLSTPNAYTDTGHPLMSMKSDAYLTPDQVGGRAIKSLDADPPILRWLWNKGLWP